MSLYLVVFYVFLHVFVSSCFLFLYEFVSSLFYVFLHEFVSSCFLCFCMSLYLVVFYLFLYEFVSSCILCVSTCVCI